jgi:hypothetical protein
VVGGGADVEAFCVELLGAGLAETAACSDDESSDVPFVEREGRSGAGVVPVA